MCVGRSGEVCWGEGEGGKCGEKCGCVAKVWGSVLGCGEERRVGRGLGKCVGVWGSRGRSVEMWELCWEVWKIVGEGQHGARQFDVNKLDIKHV